MRALIAAVALLAIPAWAADLVAKTGSDVVRLSDSPCVHAGTLAHIKPEHRELFKKGDIAFAVSKGKPEALATAPWQTGDIRNVPACLLLCGLAMT